MAAPRSVTPPAATTAGWPFLVAAGRRRDFSTLLAPDFLIAEQAHGLLTDVVTASADPGVTVLPITGPGGRRIVLIFAGHLVTSADLVANNGNGTAVGPGVERPRDEHSRPLRLAYGFAVPQAELVEPDPADLAFALDTGLPVYRRFLADEEEFTVGASTAFRLRSRTVGPTPTPTPPPSPTQASTPAPAQSPVQAPPPGPARPKDTRLDVRARRSGGLLLAGLLVLAAGIIALLVQTGVGGGGPQTPPTPTPTVSSTTDG